jgi:outer membrane receptor protein involved in Fe transport
MEEQMKGSSDLRLLAAGTSLIALCMLPTGALAQAAAGNQTQQQQTEGGDAALQSETLFEDDPIRPGETDNTAQSEDQIVVTGTRIVRDGYDAPTPTTVLGADLIESKAPTTIIDALTSLPAFKNNATAQTAGVGQAGTGGQSFANLRGLGANRTLVLLDGQRFVPSTSIATVDIGVLPSALLQRVDVVTGGASAAYGSDAVAGVVNFVLDNRFTGIKGAIETGITSYIDNHTFKASLTGGISFADRGHFMLSGEHVWAEGVFPNARPDTEYPAATLFTNPNYTPTNGEPRRLILPYVYRNTVALGGVILGGPLAGTEFGPRGVTFQQPQGTYVGTTTQVLPGRFPDQSWGDSLAFSALPQEKATGYARLSWDVTDTLTAYTTGIIATNKPGPFYSSPANTLITGAFVIRPDNAFLPENVRQQMLDLGLDTIRVGRISEDFGASLVSRTNDTYRAVIGIQGELGGGWSIDAYGQYGKNNNVFEIERNVIRANLPLAVDAVDQGLATTGVANGNIVCRSSLTNPGNGCIPLNIFGPFGTREFVFTPPAGGYIFGTSRAELELEQKVAALSISGEPFSTWAGPVSLALGAEYREESADQEVDPLSQASGYGLGNPKALAGSLDVKEAFAEVVAPLASDRPWLQTLDVNGAVRYTDYSTSGSVVTWKVGANWAPSDDIRFRATRSRDIRAPNILELFSSRVQSTAGVLDPFTNSSPIFQSFSLGNPNLDPETADTTAVGVVVQPSFVPGLQFSVDYYDISVADAISTRTLSTGATPAAPNCAR